MANTPVSIPLSQIRENEVALRNVNRDSEGYKELVDSIASKGVLNSISVRERQDTETEENYYELIDGLHRFSASKDAGLEAIPAQVIDMDDAQVMDAQLVANVHKVETKPSEYSKHLLRILQMNPMMTESDLAKKLNKSPDWIKDRLSIAKIQNEKVNQLIDQNQIPLTVAYALAKLPSEEQVNYLEQAQTESPETVVPTINARLKEINQAKRQGKEVGKAEFTPVTYLRTRKEMEAEINNHEAAKNVLANSGIESKEALQAFELALKWVLHRDPLSEEEQRIKFEEREQKKAEKKERQKAERLRKQAERDKEKAEKAAAAAEEAQKELQGTNQ